MTDLYLQALLHGQLKTNQAAAMKLKNRFDIEMDKKIDEFINALPPEEGIDKFHTPAMRLARLRHELQDDAEQEELSKQLDAAFDIIEKEGSTYLSDEQHATILAEFSKGLTRLEEISLPQDAEADFKSILSLSDPTEACIALLAEKKANETTPADSLPLYILLSVLVPSKAEYWYRAAIACHSAKNYQTAIRLYSTALALEPELVGAIIFSCDCYLECNLLEKAAAALEEAEKLTADGLLDNSWQPFMLQLSNRINALKL